MATVTAAKELVVSAVFKLLLVFEWIGLRVELRSLETEVNDKLEELSRSLGTKSMVCEEFCRAYTEIENRLDEEYTVDRMRGAVEDFEGLLSNIDKYLTLQPAA